jgi:hypothetical protein
MIGSWVLVLSCFAISAATLDTVHGFTAITITSEATTSLSIVCEVATFNSSLSKAKDSAPWSQAISSSGEQYSLEIRPRRIASLFK